MQEKKVLQIVNKVSIKRSFAIRDFIGNNLFLLDYFYDNYKLPFNQSNVFRILVSNKYFVFHARLALISSLIYKVRQYLYQIPSEIHILSERSLGKVRRRYKV